VSWDFRGIVFAMSMKCRGIICGVIAAKIRVVVVLRRCSVVVVAVSWQCRDGVVAVSWLCRGSFIVCCVSVVALFGWNIVASLWRNFLSLLWMCCGSFA
jgi:hypothetical protein